MRKEIYAALQVANHEIRILVGEHHNNRLHILKVERVAHTGMINNEIVNSEAITEAIIKAVKNIEKNVNIKVTRVLLVIPSVQLERVKRMLHSDVNDPLNRILKNNIQEVYQTAFNQKPIDNSELVNALIYQYKVNGIKLRKAPINEKSSRLFAETDLYYVDRRTVYQLASIVEQANLEILDVCIDQIGIAKEASLFDYENENFIVIINIERQATYLGLVFKGRLMHSDKLDIKIQDWIDVLSDKLKIPHEIGTKLIFNNVDLDAANPAKDPICLWSRDKKSYTCSQEDIMTLLAPMIEHDIDMINLACQGIMEAGTTEFVVVGEGSMIKGISNRLQKVLSNEVKTYIPSTLGARDGALVALLGTFYNHIDMRQWQKLNDADFELEIPMSNSKSKSGSKITKRFKKIINQSHDGGRINE